jgi:hypothetical protein
MLFSLSHWNVENEMIGLLKLMFYPKIQPPAIARYNPVTKHTYQQHPRRVLLQSQWSLRG